MKKYIILIIACMMSCNGLCQGWEILYSEEKDVKLTGGDCCANGNYIVGRASQGSENVDNSAYAMFIDNDGNYINAQFTVPSGQCSFVCAKCLDDGNAFVAGRKNSRQSGFLYDSLWIVIVNQNLELLEEHTFPIEIPYLSIEGLCLNTGNDGNMILAATVKRPKDNTGYYENDGVIYIFDNHGNLIRYKYYALYGIAQAARISDIVMMPGSNNMMLFGSGFNPYGNECVSCLDGNLEFYNHYYLYNDGVSASWLHSKVWLNDTDFLMSCMLYDFDHEDKREYATVVKCDTTMRFLDEFVYNRMDTADYTAQYCSLVYANDSTLYMPTFSETGTSSNISNDAVVCLLDTDLNLLGTNRLTCDGAYIRILHTQKTNDDGCLVYGYCWQDDESMVNVWKLLREDFAVSCSVVEIQDYTGYPNAFPNPTNDVINITIGNVADDNVTISITDSKGIKVFERDFHLSAASTISMDVSSFINGLYVYRVESKVMSFSGKFVKE